MFTFLSRRRDRSYADRLRQRGIFAFRLGGEWLQVDAAEAWMRLTGRPGLDVANLSALIDEPVVSNERRVAAMTLAKATAEVLGVADRGLSLAECLELFARLVAFLGAVPRAA